jgi:chromate reductase
MKIGLISGSLRKDSFNTVLLKYIEQNYAQKADFKMIDIYLPLFNEDLKEVNEIKKAKDIFSDMDFIIISTPEYSYSFTGVLKNYLDWMAYQNDSLNKIKIAIMSASMSVLGGSRAQYQLRQVLQGMGVFTLSRPELFVTEVHKKVENNILIDEKSKKQIDRLIEVILTI